MIVPLYYVEDSWCFLNVCIKRNNIYWIEWGFIYNERNNEISEEKNITLEYICNKNVLCIKDNMYLYYNINNKTFCKFNNIFNILSVDGTKTLETLCNLKDTYKEFLYNLDIID